MKNEERILGIPVRKHTNRKCQHPRPWECDMCLIGDDGVTCGERVPSRCRWKEGSMEIFERVLLWVVAIGMTLLFLSRVLP